MFDGAKCWGKFAFWCIIAWLCILPVTGIVVGLVMLFFVGAALYYNLHLCNQLEQRDLDDLGL